MGTSKPWPLALLGIVLCGVGCRDSPSEQRRRPLTSDSGEQTVVCPPVEGVIELKQTRGCSIIK